MGQPIDLPSTRPSEPLQGFGRIDVLDILRGIALLGMFVVHFNNYAWATAGDTPSGPMQVIGRIVGLFVDGRFYTMFGILFGVGFAIQLTRADARGESFVGRYLRRLAALAAFGIIAEGVFGGEWPSRTTWRKSSCSTPSSQHTVCT